MRRRPSSLPRALPAFTPGAAHRRSSLRRFALLLALALLLAAPAAAQAARPPVVLIVFDELPTTSLLGPGRSLDLVRYPSFAALAGDSTWFRNATTVHDSTFAVVPSILDGINHRWTVGDRVRPPQRNVLSLLSGRGYRVRASAEGGACPVRWCGRERSTRHYLLRRRAARFGAFVRSIKPRRRPTIYFKHTLLPHVPWIFLPSGKQYFRNALGPVGGINSLLGAHDRGLLHLAYQRHLLQLGAVDRLLGRLLARLRETGLYDRSLIIVTADHGVSFRHREIDRRTVTSANVAGIAPVPLFVKRPRQRRGRISSAHARVSDILPTIAGVLRVKVPWRTSGRSVFSRAVARRRTVRVAGRSPLEPVVRLSTGAFRARWDRAIRVHHGLFGFGRAGPGLYGIGPNPRLRGQLLAALRPLGAGRVRARLNGVRELREVRPGSYLRPSFISGRLTGTRGRHRELAIAVNGRIEAVCRSFRLRGRRPVMFAALVPEASLRPGRNRVQVLGVARRGGRLRLRLLGGA